MKSANIEKLGEILKIFKKISVSVSLGDLKQKFSTMTELLGIDDLNTFQCKSLQCY